MRTINFGKYLRLFQIKPIKTAEFRFMQIGKKKAKTLHPVHLSYIFCINQPNMKISVVSDFHFAHPSEDKVDFF